MPYLNRIFPDIKQASNTITEKWVFIFDTILFWTTQLWGHFEGFPRHPGQHPHIQPRSRLTYDERGFAWAHMTKKFTDALMTDTSFSFWLLAGCSLQTHSRLGAKQGWGVRRKEDNKVPQAVFAVFPQHEKYTMCVCFLYKLPGKYLTIFMYAQINFLNQCFRNKILQASRPIDVYLCVYARVYWLQLIPLYQY